MSQEEIIRADLKILRALDYDPSTSLDEDLNFAYSVYQYNQMAGEFDYLSYFVDQNAVSIDAGANVGHYSIKLAVLSKAVLSIEPIHDLNWLSHALPSNCTFINCAAGSQEEQSTLRIPILAGQQQYGMATLTDIKIFGVLEYVHQKTQIRTIDHLVQTHFPNQQIGFIKIDVEGFEREVILGAKETLKTHKPNLLLEITPEDLQETTDFLADLGYRGLFFFNDILHDISVFDASIHCTVGNEWGEDAIEDFNPKLNVNNFFFIPRH
ncbi:MAG: FkbM family methyltransferase [Anaerolineaceae bacterium]|nr:FkbM family methyltransferase [Anaerolineaceae bacterium]